MDDNKIDHDMNSAIFSICNGITLIKSETLSEEESRELLDLLDQKSDELVRLWNEYKKLK